GGTDDIPDVSAPLATCSTASESSPVAPPEGGDRNLSRTCTSPRSATTEVAGPPPAPTAPSGCTVVVRRSGDQVSGRYGRACSSHPGEGRTRRRARWR